MSPQIAFYNKAYSQSKHFLDYLHWMFLNEISNWSPQWKYFCICCIYLAFLHSVLSNVSSNCLLTKKHICNRSILGFYQSCVFKWNFKLAAAMKVFLHLFHLFGFWFERRRRRDQRRARRPSLRGRECPRPPLPTPPLFSSLPKKSLEGRQLALWRDWSSKQILYSLCFNFSDAVDQKMQNYLCTKK